MAKKKQNNVFWLGVVSFFTDFSSEMLMPILPIFYESIGINKAFIGLIEGIAESFQSFMKVISGYLSDKLKKRKVFIVFGYFVAMFMKPFFFFANGWLYTIFVRVFERSGKGFRDPPRDALIAASTDTKHYGGAFGFHRMMDTLGAVTGVIALTVILYFIENSAIRIIFLIAFFPALISVLIAGFKVKEDKKLKESSKTISLKEITHLPKKYKYFLIPTFIFAIGNMSYAFFILRAESLGLAIALLPIAYLVYTITYAAFAIPAGNLADRIGKIPTIIMSNIFFLICCTLFTFEIPTQLIWIVFVLYGMFFAFNVGVAKAYISSVVPREYNATAVGIHNFIMGICALPASAVVGYLWHVYSAETAFKYSATLAAVSTVVFIILLIKFKGRED